MPVKLISPGGGSVILDANTTASNYTVNIPAQGGAMLTTGSLSGINASAMSVGTVPRARIPSGSVIQTQYTTSTTRTTMNSTSFSEPSSNYRVLITPSSSSSIIILYYYIPWNPGANYASNTIFNFRAFRIIGGSTTFSLTSTSGSSNGSRNIYSGQAIRPQGYDLNDSLATFFTAIDAPGTTSQCTYGFQAKREGGGNGTMYFGYSSSDNSDWGWDTNINIIAQEIAA